MVRLDVADFRRGDGIPIGGVLARIERIRPDWLETEFRHSAIAFGGGALLAAVALVLVPDGIEGFPIWGAILSFAAGGLWFMGLDMALASRGTPASQLVAMLAVMGFLLGVVGKMLLIK